MALGSYSLDLLTVLRILEGPSYQDAGKIVFINSDGTRIVLSSDSGSFTYDEFGTVTGGTIDKIRYLSTDATTAIATYRNVGADIGELASLVSQLGAYRSSISWAATLPASAAGMTSTATAVTFSNIDGTYTRLVGTGLDGWTLAGTVTSVEHIAADGTTVVETATGGLPLDLTMVMGALVDDTLKTVVVAATLAGDNLIVANIDANATWHGYAGDDTMVAGNAGSVMYGDDGNDVLRGGTNIDMLYGGSGNDRLSGGNGHDALDGGIGNDILRGGDGNDLLSGDDGGDALFGDAGDDTLDGGAGRDRIYGGLGNDQINGGDGNDLIFGDLGADAINGGTGIDAVDYSASAAGITITLGGGAGTGGDAAGDTLTSIERLIGSAYADGLTGSAGRDFLYGAAGNDTISGLAGNDQIHGGAGNDTIDGGDGDDTIFGDAGADIINGGAGLDTVTYADSAAGVTISLTGTAGTGGDAAGDTLTGIEHLVGSKFADALTGSTLADELLGGAGNDTVNGGDGNDTLWGGAGNDSLTGGNNDDRLYGGTGEDTLDGGTGNDWLKGGAGNYADLLHGGLGLDTLDGGEGNDTLWGDQGDDTFAFRDAPVLQNGLGNSYVAWGYDIITDFANGKDVIDFTDTHITSLADLHVLSTGTGINAITYLSDNFGNSITLAGVKAADIDASDFIFDPDGLVA